LEISPQSQENPPPIKQLRPAEGWHVLHLFYQLDHGQWNLLSDKERLEAKTEFTRLAQEIRTTPETQLLVFSIVTPKADIGFMLLTPDLHNANSFEKRLSRSLGADILTPLFSFLSLTELNEYDTPTKEEAEKTLHPEMPDWPVFCFYNYSYRRGETLNWYALDFETRRELTRTHIAKEQNDTGRVHRIETGSTGLDDSEWGVSLFAHDTTDIKKKVYETRFDEIDAKYTEFGEFYIGIQLPLDELFRRLDL